MAYEDIGLKANKTYEFLEHGGISDYHQRQIFERARKALIQDPSLEEEGALAYAINTYILTKDPPSGAVNIFARDNQIEISEFAEYAANFWATAFMNSAEEPLTGMD